MCPFIHIIAIYLMPHTGAFDHKSSCWGNERGEGALDVLSLPCWNFSTWQDSFVHRVYLVTSRSYCQWFCALGMREHIKDNSANAREEAGKQYQAHGWASCFDCVELAVMVSSIGHGYQDVYCQKLENILVILLTHRFGCSKPWISHGLHAHTRREVGFVLIIA